MASVGVQEEDKHSISAIVTGLEHDETSQDCQGSSRRLPLPATLENDLKVNCDQFKVKAMQEMNEYVCSEPGLSVLASVQEDKPRTEHPAMQFHMTLFSLALTFMTSQVSLVKKWYRSHIEDVEKTKRDSDQELQRLQQALNSTRQQIVVLTREHVTESMQQEARSATVTSPPTSASRDVTDPTAAASSASQVSPPSSLAQHTQGYVRVEKQTPTEDGDVKLRLVEATQRETELEKKISKLKSTQKQLVEANGEWEKHCEELSEKHKVQLNIIAEEKARAELNHKEQCEQLQQQYDQLQEQYDQLQQLHDEQMKQLREKLAQSEAAYQSLVERHHQADVTVGTDVTGAAGAQRKHMTRDEDLAKRVEELELQVFELRQERSRTQHAPVAHSESRRNVPTSSRSEPRGASTTAATATAADMRQTIENLTAKLKHYKTQVAVLQAQITTFKEDFDSEKADKERYKLQKVEYQQQSSRAAAESADLRRLVAQKDREMEAVRNQNDYVRQQYTQKCRDLDAERAKLKASQAKVTRLERQLQQQQLLDQRQQQPLNIRHPPPPLTSQLDDEQTWMCPHCTFENIQQRTFCEMCGMKAPHQMHQDTYGRDGSPRLLARNVDESDCDVMRVSPARRQPARARPAVASPYMTRDIEQDTQFIEAD